MIRENLQLNWDIMLYKRNIDNSGAPVTALSQKGSFDKLDFNFILLTIYKFGYVPNLVKKVRKIFNNKFTSKLT